MGRSTSCCSFINNAISPPLAFSPELSCQKYTEGDCSTVYGYTSSSANDPAGIQKYTVKFGACVGVVPPCGLSLVEGDPPATGAYPRATYLGPSLPCVGCAGAVAVNARASCCGAHRVAVHWGLNLGCVFRFLWPARAVVAKHRGWASLWVGLGFLALAVGMYMRRKRHESAGSWPGDAETMSTDLLDSNTCLAPKVLSERKQSPEPGERAPLLQADNSSPEVESSSVYEQSPLNVTLVPRPTPTLM